jgi:hypothetical protein
MSVIFLSVVLCEYAVSGRIVLDRASTRSGKEGGLDIISCKPNTPRGRTTVFRPRAGTE